jgi:hypothetical protein
VDSAKTLSPSRPLGHALQFTIHASPTKLKNIKIRYYIRTSCSFVTGIPPSHQHARSHWTTRPYSQFTSCTSSIELKNIEMGYYTGIRLSLAICIPPSYPHAIPHLLLSFGKSDVHSLLSAPGDFPSHRDSLASLGLTCISHPYSRRTPPRQSRTNPGALHRKVWNPCLRHNR